ncbi:MLt-TeN (mlt-10) related [Caenorhabditis elegans]|uniref:MLt-TeN (Mlt-10) related n=1 Tax=Caenorhabditis elegans TaxID=6239 RepID=Q9XVH3_CAEEL|nr:MLt-TeN (mlt-10) related [Caenorhabditis elegans]CAB03459.1 MLt-TeN (mlt-10) related [Caenorhabditis elegans]|eukprot:NP_496915.1 MLt-TeN (mlt-10) related [Caenorhabditis elegans]
MGVFYYSLSTLLLLFICLKDTYAELKFEKELKVALDTKDVKASPYYKDKVLSLPISKEAGTELWQHWTDQAFSGLISAIATRRLNLVEKYDKKKHEKCSSKAHDITSHAKCLVDLESDGLKNRLLKRKKYFDQKTRSSIEKKSRTTKKSDKLKKLRSMESYEASKSAEKKKRRRTLKNSKEEPWVGSFKTARRAKRSIKVKQADSYVLKSDYDKSPFSRITKNLQESVRIFKNKDRVSKWQDIIARIRDESFRLKTRKQAENLQRKRMRVFQDAKRIRSNESGSMEERKRRKQVDGSLRSFASMEKYIDDEELKEMFHQKTSNMTEEEKMMLVPIDMIRQATKIGLGLTGHNTTDFDGKNLKVMSPRFMSILPEDKEGKGNEVDLLSPSLFSLHDEGTDIEKKTSFRSLLGSAMTDTDTQNFLDLLVEATGVAEAVEDAEHKMIDAQRMKDDAMGRGPDGQPLYFTKENITERFPSEARKIELMEKLDKTYSIEQLKDMNQTGYTVLTPKQMQLMYGKQSPFKNPKLLRTYKNMTRAEIHRSIHSTIKDVADKKLKFDVRQKDIVLSPIVNTPIINNPALASQALILSPALFVPLIQSPAVFGTVVLSPWLFVPVILSPRVLSPVILDPFMFVPIVLSPLALVPVVLSPGVFNPFILSPLVLCPFVLSPQVMTPLILSPFALTPLILNPLLMSPVILSPFVLSPQVLSPQFLTGIVLSPSALSPAIQSDGKLVTVIASPSLLS